MREVNPKQPNEVDLLVGTRIKQARRELGLTQQGIGEKLGITFQQIQKYETGKNRISAGTLYEAAVELEKPISWFFEDANRLVEKRNPDINSLYGECVAVLRSLQTPKELVLVRDFLKMAAKSS